MVRRHSCVLTCDCKNPDVDTQQIEYDESLSPARRRKLETLHNNILTCLRDVGPMDREMAVRLYQAAVKELGWQRDSGNTIREAFEELIAIGIIVDSGRRVQIVAGEEFSEVTVWAAA